MSALPLRGLPAFDILLRISGQGANVSDANYHKEVRGDMLFSTLPFICVFLPTVIVAYFILPRSTNNAVLVIASIAFYAFDDVLALIPICSSVVVNFHVGKQIGRLQGAQRRRLIGLAIAGNLVVLVIYKYTSFILDNLNVILSLGTSWRLTRVRLPLPLGISFFTFHVISYLVDVYRGAAQPQQSLPTFALYMLNFPQMIAGPIIRYRQIVDQLENRSSDVADINAGIVRLVAGLAKKLLIADPVGGVADQVFAHQAASLSPALAWTGVLAFSLQIYFDFSGYSDMAIGMARIFGFRFPENFNYPYAASSVQDFWHRWHMTLSAWFRDYVYIPLGGNRHGEWNTRRNLWIVFLLAGIWHGASWTFVVWGLWHGLFLSLERTRAVRDVLAAAGPFRHLYLLFVVAISWVFFRAETVGDAVLVIRSMLGFPARTGPDFPLAAIVSSPMATLMALAAILSLPVWPAAKAAWSRHIALSFAGEVSGVAQAVLVAMAMIGSLASMELAQQIPFIYFRF